jgi:hypothetical protein
MKLATETDRSRWIAFVQAQALPVDVSCQPWKPTRSNEQNAYLWRAVYQPLVEVAGFTKDDWHEHFCGERWGWVEHVKPSGVVEIAPARTTTKPKRLNKQEFREFVDWVEQQAADRGAFVLEEWQG